MKIFGYELSLKAPKAGEVSALEINNEGDSTILEVPGLNGLGAIENGIIPQEASQVPQDEVVKITAYRSLALNSEVDEALMEIRNEIFIYDADGKRAFDVAFREEENDTLPDSVKRKIEEEFKNVYEMVDFDKNGTKWFNKWYINGRMHMQKIYENGNKKGGIVKVVPLEPLNIRKVKVVPVDNRPGIDLNSIKTFYVYGTRDNTLNYGVMNQISDLNNIKGLIIDKDAIAYAPSGLEDLNSGKVIGYLDKAIVPFNQLRLMEDSMVIFRVVRAPQRRIFYIDVGDMSENKANTYITNMKNRFRNRYVMDSSTGGMMNQRNVMSMAEDYFMPRREGSNVTEIDTLDGQDISGVMEEVEYYRDRLWRALGVPRSRFGAESSTFVFGRNPEIARDEYRFKKFVNRLREDFLVWFEDVFRHQLIVKNIIKIGEWEEIKRTMYWEFAEDNAFVEYKEQEILSGRLNLLAVITPFVGDEKDGYYSKGWVRKNVLKQTESEIEGIKKGNEEERKAGEYDITDPDAEGPGLNPPMTPRGKTNGTSSSGTGAGGDVDSSSSVKKSVTVIGG